MAELSLSFQGKKVSRCWIFYFILHLHKDAVNINNAHLDASNIRLIVELDSFPKKIVWWFEIMKKRNSRKQDFFIRDESIHI